MTAMGMLLDGRDEEGRVELLRILDAPIEGINQSEGSAKSVEEEEDEMLAMLGLTREQAIKQASIVALNSGRD